MHHGRSLLVAGVILVAGGLSPAAAGDGRPGLVLTLEAAGGSSPPGGRVRDCRSSRLLALHVPEGSPPSPFLPPGPFRAVWEGQLELALGDSHTFSAEGRGAFTLWINGERVLEASGKDLGRVASRPVDLRTGKNQLRALYESPPAGDGSVRLLWSSADFPPEPVPPAALVHEGEPAPLAGGRRLRRGLRLLAERRCLLCHGGAGETALDELSREAPSFEGIGDRLEEPWMAAWIQDPRSLLSTAAMPRLLAGSPGPDPRAADIAAYLATLGKEEAPALPAGREPLGGRLFLTLGCVACHTLQERDDPERGFERMSLDRVSLKWRPLALAGFLRKPERHHPWTAMPDFALAEEEAEALAAFLLSLPRKVLPGAAAAPRGDPVPPPGPAAPRGDPVRGERLLVSSGCLHCHRLSAGALPAGGSLAAPSLRAIPEEGFARGCLAGAGTARGRAPDLGLDADDRAALRSLRAVLPSALVRHSAVDFAEGEIEALRCLACHSRDGRLDAWTLLLPALESLEPALKPYLAEPPPVAEAAGGGSGSIDQTRPHLTWAGEKLRPEWMARFLAGEVPDRVRPWLKARMPAFPRRAAAIARGLCLENGRPPSLPPEPAADPAQGRLGRRLVLRDQGFGCVSCHDVGGYSTGAVFEARGVNLMYSAERLRHDFYLRWMMSPLRVVPESRMPQFADREGRSPFASVLDGDARKQFEAIWQYLLEGRKISPPDP